MFPETNTQYLRQTSFYVGQCTARGVQFLFSGGNLLVLVEFSYQGEHWALSNNL